MTKTTAAQILRSLNAPTFDLASYKAGDIVTSTHIVRYEAGRVVVIAR